MALIKCPECGQEVSDEADVCIHCGYPLKKIKEESTDENEQTTDNGQEANEEETAEDSELSNEQISTENPANDSEESLASDSESNNSQESEITSETESNETINVDSSVQQDDTVKSDSNNTSNKKSNRRIAIIVAAVIAVCAVIGGVAYYNNVQQQKAERIAQADAEKETVEAYNFYIDNLNKYYSTALTGASEAESVCVLTQKVWYDAIYKNGTYEDETSQYISGSSDFNDALEKLYSDTDILSDLSEVQASQDSVSKYLTNLQTPSEEFEKAFDAAVSLNSAFASLTNLALNPSGVNYNEYSSKLSSYQDSFMSLYTVLTALVPQKKAVPVFDKDGYEIEDEFPYDIYLNEPASVLPSTVDDSMSYLGRYTEEISICGIEGKLSYSVNSGLVWYISWTANEPNSKDADTILSQLSDKYGDDYIYSEEQSAYDWDDSEHCSYVLFTVKDNQVEISCASYL